MHVSEQNASYVVNTNQPYPLYAFMQVFILEHAYFKLKINISKYYVQKNSDSMMHQFSL